MLSAAPCGREGQIFLKSDFAAAAAGLLFAHAKSSKSVPEPMVLDSFKITGVIYFPSDVLLVVLF